MLISTLKIGDLSWIVWEACVIQGSLQVEEGEPERGGSLRETSWHCFRWDREPKRVDGVQTLEKARDKVLPEGGRIMTPEMFMP